MKTLRDPITERWDMVMEFTMQIGGEGRITKVNFQTLLLFDWGGSFTSFISCISNKRTTTPLVILAKKWSDIFSNFPPKKSNCSIFSASLVLGQLLWVVNDWSLRDPSLLTIVVWSLSSGTKAQKKFLGTNSLHVWSESDFHPFTKDAIHRTLIRSLAPKASSSWVAFVGNLRFPPTLAQKHTETPFLKTNTFTPSKTFSNLGTS